MIQSPNNRLDEFVKEGLKNHEVPYNEAHWQEFESKLDAMKPRATNPLRKWNFSLNLFIGLIVAGSASAFIYNAVSSPSADKPNNPQQVTPVHTVNKNEVAKTGAGSNTAITSSSNTPEVNSGSDNSFSAFTSSDISNAGSVHSEDNTNANKTATYPIASNNSSSVMNSAGSRSSEKIDPTLLRQVLKDAKNGTGGPVILFPDMIDSRKGPIYKTKESDTIKEKAMNDVSYFNLLYKKDANGNKVADPDSVKSFFDNAQKKSDSGYKPVPEKQEINPNTTVPSDSLNTSSNNH